MPVDTATLIAKFEAATIPNPGYFKPARFAAVVRREQDPPAVAAAIQAALAPLGARVEPLSNLDHRTFVIILPDRVLKGDPAPAFEAAYELVRQFDLEAAEPDILTDVFPEPDPRRAGAPAETLDDFPPGCWAAEQPDLNGKPRWALEKLSLPEAWTFSEARGRPSRGQGIVIAQPDTGVAAHPELTGVIRVPSIDLVGEDDDPTDPLDYQGNPGHGTGTGSVVVSPEPGNMCGSAPKAKHMPIRAIESVVRLSQVAVAQAIDFAVENGAHVITMSLGGFPSFSLYRALTRAVQSDVIVLAAAGNCVGIVVFPARYDDCVAVAGTNSNDARWQGSSNGPDVDIAAPAQNVFRAKVEQGKPPAVGQGQGTSFAVALTAGVAACWLAHHGRANLIAAAHARGETLQAMFMRLLKATARRPPGWDGTNLGAGIANARRLLAADFDLDRDKESAAAVPVAEAPALAVRRLVAEAISPEAARSEVDWNLYGPELTLAILQARLGRAPAKRGEVVAEAAAAPPSLSPTLESVVAGKPPLESALGLGNGAGG
jgi:hypothetical protein